LENIQRAIFSAAQLYEACPESKDTSRVIR